MKTSDCILPFAIISSFLFKINLSQGSSASPQDGDHIFRDQCGGTYPHQNASPSLLNNDINQSKRGNCAESLTWKTEEHKVMEASGTEHSLESKTRNINNSEENLTMKGKFPGKNFTQNVLTPEGSFLSRQKQDVILMLQGKSSSLISLPEQRVTFHRDITTWNASISQVGSISRLKRDAAQNNSKGINTLFGLQKSEDIFKADQSLEALLRKIIEDHINGCDLIIVYDEIYMETRTLETLVSFPVITQILQLTSLEDLSETIKWDSKNCQGTMLLMSDADVLINFGRINRFLWAYKAKVIIVGLKLHSLEKFLKTVKGRKTEHVIGIVQDPRNHQLEVYMNLLFWGEGMQLLTDWSGNRFTRRADLFPDKIKDLRNAKLTVLIFEYGPILFYEFAPDRTIVGRHGRFLSVIRALAEKFNFTIKFKDIESEWGQPLGNGSFDGLVGYLQRDEGHLGLPYNFHSGLQDRHLAQDFSRFIEDDRSCFFIRREAPRPAWQSLGLPFTPQSWIAVICGIILSGPIFHLLVMASTVTGEEYKNFKSLSYSSLFTIGVQIDEPLPSMPKRLCNQIFILFLLIYGLILSTGYRSNLISFLTVARPPHQINTFKELAESGLPVYGVEWFYYALQVSGDPYIKEVLKRYKIRYTMEENIDEFMEGKVLHINSRATFEGLSTLMRTKTGKPMTRNLKECLQSYTGTIGLPWHTPLKPRFNKAIARLVESGIPRQWVLELNEYYKKLTEKEGGVTYYPDIWYDVKDGLIPLGNSHLTGIWAIVALGYLFATISFALEVISPAKGMNFDL